MPLVTILAVIVFVGYITVTGITARKNSSVPRPTSEVKSAVDETSPMPSASLVPSPTPISSTKPKTSGSSPNSQIKIEVDTQLGNTTPSLVNIIYPSASQTNGNEYEVNERGATVYDWYKSEMSKRNYQIRNNVKTQANEKFKGVLQGVSGSSSLKVTIDQENYASKTVIHFGE